jgi:hypothetical protein
MATMTAPASFKTRVEGVCAFAKRATWRAGWGGTIRTSVVDDGEVATVRVDMLGDPREDHPLPVPPEAVAAFGSAVKLAAKTMGLVLVSLAPDGFVVRARTKADREREAETRKLVARARWDAHDEATIHAAPNSKLASQRGAEEPPRRDWRTATHAEQCAGIAEALDVLRLALEPLIGTAEGQAKAASAVVRIAAASPSREVREKAALRLRELGRAEDAGEIDRPYKPRG